MTVKGEPGQRTDQMLDDIVSDADEYYNYLSLNYPRLMGDFQWRVFHGLVLQKDEDGTELYSLAP